ncbi:hypothetical protein PR048_014963 [Dryococelus australis]|uniref:Uncharacterized protein n=1 Tax=Dryococelus australis TaxID=614101 RepID=A0ABQ9HFM9_9NEOP|nr:hypothetical protein PR048_014963 [Dryococelus australis]
MRQIVASQPYGPNFLLTKIECNNHIMRNYNWRLREIATKTKNATGSVPGSVRRLLNADRQLRLRVAVTSTIGYRSAEDLPL